MAKGDLALSATVRGSAVTLRSASVLECTPIATPSSYRYSKLSSAGVASRRGAKKVAAAIISTSGFSLPPGVLAVTTIFSSIRPTRLADSARTEMTASDLGSIVSNSGTTLKQGGGGSTDLPFAFLLLVPRSALRLSFCATFVKERVTGLRPRFSSTTSRAWTVAVSACPKSSRSSDSAHQTVVPVPTALSGTIISLLSVTAM
mmetsp:Transcript_13878/g.35308  ORF Transcript_13878/g.35308 Transcript_13878/m.35308 type:complete len:203 (+) Transcript_13878:2531-3139(+)